MLTSAQIIEKAHSLNFEDVGFTTAEPFESQKEILAERREAYAWAMDSGLDLMAGTDPKTVLPEAQTVIVLMEVYFRQAYPASLEPFFGRCYLDDDRVTKDGLAVRLRAFRDYLRENGIRSKVPFHLPHRLAAARAGMGTFGKNCLFYSNAVARQSSWVLPIAVVVDAAFSPGTPTLEVGCPDWCKNVCLVACPTGALKGSRHIDPRKCISFLTYFGQGITPRQLRAPMGLWIYGCDRCQNVCPRNAAWLAADLPPNLRAKEKAGAFELSKLLHMDRPYFEQRIWPHMFYMSADDLWRWKMNVARVMGNTLDSKYVPELIRAFRENDDDRVRGMCAWALGRIGTDEARRALADFRGRAEGAVVEEIVAALDGRS
ncbi:MAG: epoxyqueuosine reductase [Desulfobacterales bacterium]|nr:epoxyqueuosine reductase [Desulfobacterales bacterium]